MGLFGLPDIKVETPNVNLDEVANAFVNTVTMGLAGVKDGKLDVKKGIWTRAVDEGIGEVTGRNAARAQAADARTALEKEAQAKETQRQNDLLRKKQEDTAASNYAAAARRTAEAQTNAALGFDSGTSNDFLGL